MARLSKRLQPAVRTTSRTLRVVRAVLLAGFGWMIMLTGCQRSLMYHPRRAAEAVLLREAAQADLRPWRTADGGWFGWRRDSDDPDARRILVFHGNAGCAVDRAYYADAFGARPGGTDWHTAVLEYPGYGARPGSPSESSLLKAALAALDALWHEQPRPVWLLGESLGSGVAALVASERPGQVAGLLLVTPFTSFVDVARHHFPRLPVRWLMLDRYETAKALRGYDGPLAVVLAEQDEVVPAHLGQALYEGYEGPGRLWIQEGRTHNTLELWAGAAWWSEVARFLTRSPDVEAPQ